MKRLILEFKLELMLRKVSQTEIDANFYPGTPLYETGSGVALEVVDDFLTVNDIPEGAFEGVPIENISEGHV